MNKAPPLQSEAGYKLIYLPGNGVRHPGDCAIVFGSCRRVAASI